jgi:hypothetical protein
MGVSIISRHKDGTGNTISYTAIINGNLVNSDPETLINEFGNTVDNAILVNNKEYRAKKGCSIKTIVDKSSLAVQPILKPSNIIKSNFPNDYYGREFISVCRRIRKYANAGCIEVVTDKHKSNSGNNVHLFDIIKLCGIDVQSFVSGYLSVLQPYNLKYYNKATAKNAGHIWMIEMGYSTAMLIKLDERDKNHPIIISFHEDNIVKKNSYYQGSGIKDFSDKPCALLIENCNKFSDTLIVSTHLQTGFIRYSISLSANAVNNDVALVNYSEIKQMVNKILDEQFNRLTSTYISSASMIEVSDKNNILSFSGRGYATINQLIMIIDIYAVNHDRLSSQLLTEVVENIIGELDEESKMLTLGALKNKYGSDPRNKMASLICKELSV